MGSTIVLPEADENTNKAVKAFFLSPKDISMFYKCFQKLDRNRTGLVKLELIFKTIEWQRNLMTDCILELLEIEHEGEVNFSEFLYMVTSYCFFEPPEILRYMFYCFDQDKTGFFEIEDLNSLLNAVQYVREGETVKGNVKTSWGNILFSGDQVDYNELKKIHNDWPQMFAPAFRLQQQMMFNFGGELWWTFKKRANQNLKEKTAMLLKKEQNRKEEKKTAKKNAKILRNMGFVRYYLCPWNRYKFDPAKSAYDFLTEDEKKKKDIEFALAKRKAELAVKNPDTTSWQKYQAKAVPKAGGQTEFLELKIVKAERAREIRQEMRLERRQNRKDDTELQLKPRLTVSGVDM